MNFTFIWRCVPFSKYKRKKNMWKILPDYNAFRVNGFWDLASWNFLSVLLKYFFFQFQYVFSKKYTNCVSKMNLTSIFFCLLLLFVSINNIMLVKDVHVVSINVIRNIFHSCNKEIYGIKIIFKEFSNVFIFCKSLLFVLYINMLHWKKG